MQRSALTGLAGLMLIPLCSSCTNCPETLEVEVSCLCEFTGDTAAPPEQEDPPPEDTNSPTGDACSMFCDSLDECSWLDGSHEWGNGMSECETWCAASFADLETDEAFWKCAAEPLMACDLKAFQTCL